MASVQVMSAQATRDLVDEKVGDASGTVLGVIDYDEVPPAAGVWLRRPAP
jgi:hypothetical protein